MASDSKPSSRSKPRVVLFEDLWSVVGGFGRYPVLLFVFMCYVTIAVDLQQFIQIYYGSAPNYQCQPWGNTTNSTRCTTKDQCGCTNCTFVFGDEFTSAVSEWLLICDRSHLKALSQSVFYGGLLVGSVGFGKLSDKFGRKPSLFLSLLLMNDFMTNLPFIVFGVMALTAGFLALFLPETLFSPMPQTVDQVEAWPEDFQLPCRKRIRKPEEVPIREDSAHHNDTRTTSL